MHAISFQSALDQAFQTIRRTIPRMGADRPRIGRDDLTYERCGDNDWVDGFWPGQLWLAYAETQDPVFFDAARAQRPYFAARIDRPDSHSHDLGFLYTHSTVADYKLTGDDTARAISLAAAEALSRRYNPAGRFIQAWNKWTQPNGAIIDNRGRIIVDCMENLALLYWAAQESGEARYADIATDHAHTTARYIVREDGSTYHTYFFDPASGAPLRGETHQGYADESCWSRGQAWAIHGFTVTYTYTRLPEFRDMARRLADYAIVRLPEDGVPLWDYRLPDDAPHYRDTSAAAIMAAGLLLLADQVEDGAAYRDTAHRILNGLIAGYTTVDYANAEGLLLHGASHVSAGRADNMLPYGDYFYVEALLRALGRQDFSW